MKSDLTENVKHTLDGAAALTTVATLMAALPPIAALLTIIWTGIRIWETETVRAWRGKAPLSKESE